MTFGSYKHILNFNELNNSDNFVEIYCISDEEGNELFDVLEEDFITMVDLGLVNSEGLYYLLNKPSMEQIAEYAKKFGIMWI